MPSSSSNQLAWRAGPAGLYPLPVFLLTLILIGLSMLVGDALVFHWRPASIPREVWVLFDPLVHATLALLVISPLLLHRPMPLRRLPSTLAPVTAAAVLIDLDHFAAAGSLSIAKAISLPGGRPETHSLLFALVCGLLVFWLRRDVREGWLVWAALASHVLRDSSTGSTPLLWPFPFQQLSLTAYYASQLGLCLANWALAKAWLQTENLAPERRQVEGLQALPALVPVSAEPDER